MEKRLTSEIKQFIRAHFNENPTSLLFKKTALESEDLKTAVHQIFCRKKYKHKLPEWCDREDLLFPPTLSMEQCSSEYTAKKKANIIEKGQFFIDITGGLGVDSFYISKNFQKSIHVEKNKELAYIAYQNLKALNANIEAIHDDGVLFLDKQETIYDALLIDPARRHGSKGKVYLLEDCEPNVLDIEEKLLTKATNVYIKLSPMLDIHVILEKLKNTSDIYVIAYRNEVKELFCKITSDFKQFPTIHAINIHREGRYSEDFCATIKSTPTIASKLEKYIYEPNKAILKADIQDSLSTKYRINKIHPFSHIYTSDKLHLSFPGRVLLLKHSTKAQAKALKSIIPEQKANVLIRNFPESANTLANKLKLKDGGSLYVIGTTLWTDEKRILICERVK